MSGGHCHLDLPIDCALLGRLRAPGVFSLKSALELKKKKSKTDGITCIRGDTRIKVMGPWNACSGEKKTRCHHILEKQICGFQTAPSSQIRENQNEVH